MEKLGTKLLETDRLILRRFTIDDADEMYNNWASDTEVTKFLTWPTHPNVDVTKAVLNKWISNYEDGSFFNWAIVYKEQGKVIGNISVVRFDESVEAAEIGYCMSRALWGRGIMPEALKVVMDFLFDEIGFNRVAACHASENPKSGRVMEKAGMKLEGVLRESGRNNLGVCDKVWHAMIKSDRV